MKSRFTHPNMWKELQTARPRLATREHRQHMARCSGLAPHSQRGKYSIDEGTWEADDLSILQMNQNDNITLD